MQLFETIRTRAEGEGKCIRQRGGRGEFAHVRLLFEPLQRGGGFEFRERVVEGGAIPERFLGHIESAVLEALRTGPVHGFEVVDVRITVIDGSYHAADSTAEAFREAATSAFCDAAAKVEWIVLEPILAFEVVVPEEFAGHTMGEINSRRGMVKPINSSGGNVSLSGLIPKEQMPAFMSELAIVTGGRAICRMQRFSHYEDRPGWLEPPEAWAVT